MAAEAVEQRKFAEERATELKAHAVEAEEKASREEVNATEAVKQLKAKELEMTKLKTDSYQKAGSNSLVNKPVPRWEPPPNGTTKTPPEDRGLPADTPTGPKGQRRGRRS